jgi:hypothetical protein
VKSVWVRFDKQIEHSDAAILHRISALDIEVEVEVEVDIFYKGGCCFNKVFCKMFFNFFKKTFYKKRGSTYVLYDP